MFFTLLVNACFNWNDDGKKDNKWGKSVDIFSMARIKNVSYANVILNIFLQIFSQNLKYEAFGLAHMTSSGRTSFVGVTIAAKNDYCDTIDIAGSTIAILLLLWTTIAILL